MSTREELVRDRLRASHKNICYAIDRAREGNPYAAEKDKNRRVGRIQTKSHVTPAAAALISEAVTLQASAKRYETRSEALVPRSVTRPAATTDGREGIWGDTLDFLNVAFLEKGAQVARSVGRIATIAGDPRGTGFLVGNGLFITNNHVILRAEQLGGLVVEFDYERDISGRPRQVTRFRFDGSVFLSDPDTNLDYTLVALGPVHDGPGNLADFGFSGLSDAGDKHMIGEFANIVQHPNGRHKEVVLRENRLVNRLDNTLHYIADTDKGSSGSPVYNSEWQVIALHHWGGPWLDQPNTNDVEAFEINEGIRISRIVPHLRARLGSVSADVATRVDRMLELGAASWQDRGSVTPESSVPVSEYAVPAVSSQATGPRIEPDGRVTWTLPIEVSVRLPGAMAQAPAVQIPPQNSEANSIESYIDRQGYDPHFLPGVEVPLPQLVPAKTGQAARLLAPLPGANPTELKYHHFSVVMNRERKLAFFTACNIDGATAKAIDRSDGTITDLMVDAPGLAEGDNWQNDPRLSKDDYAGLESYEGQHVPGFPTGFQRILRMFQRGHLVRRIDPAWGSDEMARAAERDTFHWTNAAPQVGFFNMGRGDPSMPGTAGGGLWRTTENFVLRNAVAEDQRVVSFTGPVFRDDDRAYRTIKVPASFFKVTVWVEGGQPKSLALLADQSQVFREWPEGIGDLRNSVGREAFQDPAELSRVSDFLTTVAEIEDRTGIDFGTVVRDADIRSGATTQPTDEPDLIALFGHPVADGTHPIDDLTRINGIGPIFVGRLSDLGIHHFQQIANLTDAEAAELDDLIHARGGIFSGHWVQQARDILAGG